MFGASQPGRLQLTCRGAGGIIPAAQAENANTVPRSAVPAPARNARHFLLHPRYKLFRRNADVTAWSGRGITFATNRHDMARPCVPDQPPWFGLLSGCSWQRLHTTNTPIYIHARASAARFSDNVTAQGKRFRKAPRGASGSAASLMAADVDGGRAMDAPKRPRRRPGAGTPGRGAGCCWRPKIEGRRMHSSGREGQPEKKIKKNLPCLLTFSIYLYIFVYTKVSKFLIAKAQVI